MRIAYADPPYLGQAKKHYGNHPDYAGEVDHLALLRRLETYDGWALSLSTPSLFDIVPMVNQVCVEMEKDRPRIASWVKPFASWKPGVNPAYAWEPVIFRSARPGRREVVTVRDWVSANITLRRTCHGAKPEAFNYWLFDVLGMIPDDDFDDLFPGSGAVKSSWELWRRSLWVSLQPAPDIMPLISS